MQALLLFRQMEVSFGIKIGQDQYDKLRTVPWWQTMLKLTTQLPNLFPSFSPSFLFSIFSSFLLCLLLCFLSIFLAFYFCLFCLSTFCFFEFLSSLLRVLSLLLGIPWITILLCFEFRFRMESIDCWFTARIPCIFPCCICGIRNCSISVSNKWCDRENRYAILTRNDDFDVDEICISPKRTVTLNYPTSMKLHAPVVFILILRSTSLRQSLLSWHLFDFNDFVHVFFSYIRRFWQWMVAAHSH